MNTPTDAGNGSVLACTLASKRDLAGAFFMEGFGVVSIDASG